MKCSLFRLHMFLLSDFGYAWIVHTYIVDFSLTNTEAAVGELVSHTTGPGFKTPVGTVLFLPSFWLSTTIPASWRCAFASVYGRLGKYVWPKILNSVVVLVWRSKSMDSTTTAPCQYSTVTGWGVMSCVCGMAFLCGNTLVKVPLLQVGTVAIWPQMFKSDFKPQQTAWRMGHLMMIVLNFEVLLFKDRNSNICETV